ncbi:protein FAR1-RELATED SEQUENCE 2-like isoform X1 [Lycium barbarum]|uniref:protein FAR1-RELATED SEQUENCE 2-like isoform X1 n=1 Tax=Lycium barbarum TaxID=112863 RepID=UPI00293F43DE|nr:protein FAR1-RELATED SEQUENCE 2-like isoform X1 [Lycium barbarum]XP_060188147.1 protein FAR1-RELATED SEQUENCE 2-like isoform X1 [Lycium barbarum]
MEIDLELPSGFYNNNNIPSVIQLVGSPLGLDKKLDNYVGTSAINDSIQSHGGKENVEENVDGSGNETGIDIVDVDVIDKGIANSEPQKGMEFETKEAAYSFYKEYARSVGFGITIKASRRSKKSGKFIDVKIACSRFGAKRECGSSRSCPKTDCKASIHVKRKQDGKWYINSFVKEHNHEICPDDFYYSVKGRSKQSANVVYEKKGLQLVLDEGDVELLLDTLSLMQAERPHSYYAIDFDKEKRMRNVFWIDAKGRNDYVHFCDVIYLDSYYIRNKYKVPFLPIIGVNHHFQFLLLGCALVGDESLSTFSWLMHTWLRSVGGQSPKVVITDDEISLKEAVDEVFPDARHCFCLWHVMGKVSQNLGNKISNTEDFVKKLKKCMWLPLKEEEFEKGWWKMVDSFKLRDDDLIRSLFENRTKWVPVYMRNTFLAGLSTVERSESVSFFFNSYISSKTTFKGFIDQYKLFMHGMYEEEAKADIETRHRKPIVKTLSPYENQMSAVYTNSVFMKFQAEVVGVAACTILNEVEEGTEKLFKVNDRDKNQSFMVSWGGRESCIACSCHFFEYTGILCRHAVTVLKVFGVPSIPPVYILERWTREAKIKGRACGILSNPLYRTQRLNDLCKLAAKLGEVGSLSQETYESAVNALKAAMNDCVNANNSVKSASVSNFSFSQCNHNVDEAIQGGSMAKSSKRKKVQKKRKYCRFNLMLKYYLPVSKIAAWRWINQTQNYQLMKMLSLPRGTYKNPGPRMETIDGYYFPHQSVHGLGLLSSFSMLQDSYYSNHQASQNVLGNLNYISPHGGHYSPQSIQGPLQGQLSFRAPLLHTSFDIRGNSSDMDNSTSVTGKHMQD